jgi:hypothetical protein
MPSDIDLTKLIGGKKKNGHKMNCTCHICENMKAKAKRNGYEEDLKKEKEKKMGGPQKKNGHKKDCNCPICINMKNMKGGKKTMKNVKKSKYSIRKKGGGDDNEYGETYQANSNEYKMLNNAIPTSASVAGSSKIRKFKFSKKNKKTYKNRKYN